MRGTRSAFRVPCSVFRVPRCAFRVPRSVLCVANDLIEIRETQRDQVDIKDLLLSIQLKKTGTTIKASVFLIQAIVLNPVVNYLLT